MNKYIICCLFVLAGCSSKPHHIQPLSSQKVILCKVNTSDVQSESSKEGHAFAGDIRIYSLISFNIFASREETNNELKGMETCEPVKNGEHFQVSVGG